MDRNRKHGAARRDLVAVIVATVAVAVLSAHFEVSERFLAWTRPHEHYQLDELPGVLLFLAAGLAWYAWRRVADARAELRMRRAAEDRLRMALAENRDLALSAVRVSEQERRSLAWELHDELGQTLNAAKIDAVWLRDDRGHADVPASAARIVVALDHVEGVVRSIVGRLRPAGLDDLGLAAALEHCVEGWRMRMPGVSFRLSLQGDVDTFDEATNITLYRIVQEGLTNVAKHAAAALVEIELVREPGDTDVVLTMRDDGIGGAAVAPRKGVGLIGMRERVEALAGRFEIVAPRGQGFAVVARLPVPGAAAA